MSRVVRFFGLLVIALGVTLPAQVWADDDPAPAAQPSGVVQNFWQRHIKILGADVGLRWRYNDKRPHERDAQYGVSLRTQFNLVSSGNSYFYVRTETGRSFQSSWNYAGIGYNPRTGSFNVKSFFYGQRFGRHVEFQVGGIEFDRGAGSEMTYADDDGWLVGYRLRLLTSGRGWMPNKFSVTGAYLGNFSQPNVFARLHRIGTANYWQVLAQKKFGEHVDASAEFFMIQRQKFARAALGWNDAPLFLFDTVRLEMVTRVTGPDDPNGFGFSQSPKFGWAGIMTRKIDRQGRLRAGVFYSHILNELYQDWATFGQLMPIGDFYANGRRLGGIIQYEPIKHLRIIAMGSWKLDWTRYNGHNRGQVMVKYDFGWLIERAMR